MSLAQFAADTLAASYGMCGEVVQYMPAGGGAASDRTMIFAMDGSAVLDGMVQSLGPSLRGMAPDFPNGIRESDQFVRKGVTWRAREGALPLNDGDELLVQLSRG